MDTDSKVLHPPVGGAPVRFRAADGYELGGFLWHNAQEDPERPVLIVSAATSVRCRYYARFALYMFQHGFDVLTYDYRGIGESRPGQLKGFEADWVDWGEQDLEGALQYVAHILPGRPLRVIGHSIGGFAIGLAPSNRRIGRILSVGSQYAYWRDYAARHKLRMLWKWHVVMPLLTRLFGYFPAKRLGWMEDTPAGVVHDWSGMTARFEDRLRAGRTIAGRPEGEVLCDRFAQVEAPILAISFSDDPHGTVPAVNRLLAYFKSSECRHMHLKPSDVGHDSIGHFAFFHDRFRDTFWPLALHWLRHGRIPPGLSSALISLPLV
ncbi:alpha/beta hydrolase family protein [Affinirhizobium pseudoryzae]|jgi:predicted alpha/beta hydrolase|uniref:alpha/beta hydrolase family protein n=1 Tax=Allorhizobium pseudoryzae TaxID=379684 RepID=UPI0013EB68C4|nr:alpha/beta fold hydrolase [Allorhizobium pseudoryzae]